LKAADDLVALTGNKYVRCSLEGKLLEARILLDQGDYAKAGQVLEETKDGAGRYSIRDLEAQSLCLLGKVQAEQGKYVDAMADCSEGLELTRHLGQATYDCLTICADVSMAAGESGRALEFLGPAIDEAATVYSQTCPARMRQSFLDTKHVSAYVSRAEDILTGLGRADEAHAYAAKFPLK
jgi:tetratricopeptide (TPR) repeat protein